jgi:hypothetical protein
VALQRVRAAQVTPGVVSTAPTRYSARWGPSWAWSAAGVAEGLEGGSEGPRPAALEGGGGLPEGVVVGLGGGRRGTAGDGASGVA